MMQNKLITEISAMRNIDINPPVITFAEYYGIDITKYEHIYIEECDFSTRLYNALRGKCQITKMSELFSMTLYDFAKIKGLGITSIDELDNYLSNISTKDNLNIKNHNVHKTHNPIPSIIVKHKDDITCGDFSFIKNEALGESDVDVVMKYKDAYEVLGDELVFDCVLEPNKIFPIVSMLSDFFSQFEKNKKYNEQLNQLLEQLPQDILKQNSEHYIRAYTKDADKQECIFNLYDKNDTSIDAIVKHSFEAERDFVEACRFISWCKFDIKENIQSLFDELYKNENQRIIIEARAQGKTLEQSGHLIGVTRERVRQIEKKIKERFLVWQSKNRLLMKIMAVRNGDSVLTALELADYFEEYTSVLLYMLRNTPSKTYTYDSYLDVFIMGNDDLSAQVQEYVEQLPDTFKYEDYEEEINKLDSDNELPKELVLKAIHEEFDITGTVYHRNRLSLTEIYKTTINKFYPDGIKVYDETEIEKFRQVIINNYGNVSLPKNNRAISARLADIGVLCGRGIYKPQQEKYISIELEQKILKYITESNSVIFLTNTLFSVFEEELIKYGIDNKYYLQGVLHQLFGDKFVFRRDYISKDDSVSSIYVAIMEFIKKCDYPISKQEIKNAFPGITEIVLNLAINETGILNYFGEYLHTSKLRLYDYDKTYFTNVIDIVLSDGEIHHCRDIYDYIEKDNEELLSRLCIKLPFSLFSVLSIFFNEKYQFDRPYIAQKGVTIGKTTERLKEYVYSHGIISIADIMDYAKDMHMQVNSIIELLNSYNDEYLIMDSDSIATNEYIGVSESVAKIIEMKICAEINQTMLISELKCIHDLPNINVQWSDWLIYSIINKYSDKLEVATTYNQFRMSHPIISLKNCMDYEFNSEPYNNTSSEIVQVDNLDDLDSLIEDYIEEEIVF